MPLGTGHKTMLSLPQLRLKKIFALSTVLGTGWIFGFIVLATTNYTNLNTALRWLYILSVAPQVCY